MIQILLLRNGHVHPVGFPTGLVVSSTDALFQNLGALTEKLHKADPKNLENAYYTVGHHAGLGGGTPIRTKLSYEQQTILAFDIDYVDQGRAWDYLPIVAKIMGVSQQSLIFISTGNGLHIIAQLKTPIRSSKYLEETKPHYNEVVYKINSALKDAGLPGQADPAIWDAPRILRLPNTINKSEKKGTKEAKLLQYPGYVALDLDIIKISGLDLVAKANISPVDLKKNFPRPDFPTVMSQCEFLKWMATSPGEVHEPQFMSAVGLLGAIHPGDKAFYQNKETTAIEVARGVFESACSSKSLQDGDFDRKWEHGTRYGAPRCQTISQNWLGGCEKCPHFGKINTPLALKSESHISSELNGYWEHGRNGPIHPHYSDLARLYQQTHSYVTCDADRIFTFNQTHYRETGHLSVKAWLEHSTGHPDKLREAHCMEFVKKVLRSNHMDETEALDLFEKSIRGKLNCQNGVVDVLKGNVIPHSSALGFKYVLPYAYEQGQVSEFFLDWLGEMMLNRTELMDAVLDMMAYCLWPSYDDHVFCYLIGEGSNGKGTLIHILQELLGRENYSAISMSQLATNRFAPANLEGKLANISEESSGTDLSFEELNIIKDLSAGGEIQVERKGQHPFNLRNHSKMIFSANKTPRFREQGVAIRRRLLAIPFEYNITERDPRVEKRLLAEIPKICSMLVSRIQENVNSNGGRFIVSRGGAVAQEAQDRVLLAGNSVIEWGRDHVESTLSLSEEQYIACQEAYTRYTHWCQENNYKPVNSKSFGQMMARGVLSNAVGGSIVKKIGGKPIRIYPRAQWKEVIL